MIELRRILCPSDFSDFSRRGLAQAMELARWSGATLEVLHVHTNPVPALAAVPVAPTPAAITPPVSLPPDSEVMRALDEQLRHFVKPAEQAGIQVATSLEQGDPVNTILEHAGRDDVDLVVMGTHGRSGFQRLFLGSIAEKVLRAAPCPVLTVRAQASAQAVPRRVLCPVDLSESSKHALRWAMALAANVGTQLQVLHVIEVVSGPQPVFGPEGQLQQAMEGAREDLDKILGEVELGLGVTGRVRPERTVVRGKPSREIVRVAKDEGADLVVMGVHGQGAVSRMLFGSTTHHVVREAPCPVLSVRPAADRASA